MQAREQYFVTPSASLQFVSVSQKGTYTLVWSPYFCDCNPGDIPDRLALMASMAYTCSLIGLYIFACFKVAARGSGFQSA